MTFVLVEQFNKRIDGLTTQNRLDLATSFPENLVDRIAAQQFCVQYWAQKAEWASISVHVMYDLEFFLAGIECNSLPNPPFV